ncbi:hypothetical protein E6Q11_05190 [Candidatus Dojkabacteria bacterium]|uniref:Uncharacterized protein n=1 Tax=Candidatus Dojkabacteria bacterium TaxID=2099670 RepID=A0A5C7J3Y0_9BACT|nr:MAG: hypothetical protein E6Q11_05190 [Candidatus Dojkabacteria bacterium]
MREYRKIMDTMRVTRPRNIDRRGKDYWENKQRAIDAVNACRNLTDLFGDEFYLKYRDLATVYIGSPPEDAD